MPPHGVPTEPDFVDAKTPPKPINRWGKKKGDHPPESFIAWGTKNWAETDPKFWLFRGS